MKNYSILLTAFICIIWSCSKKNILSPSEGDTSNPTAPSLIPNIIDFNPKTGKVGETVIIKGENFGMDASKVKIQFGNSVVTSAKTISDSEIAVVVPNDASNGQISITVSDHNTIKSKDQFLLILEELKQPTISGFSPTSGNIGQEVTVSGTNFGNDASRITITLVNGTLISPKSVTPTQIVFILPPNSVTGVLSVQIIGFQNITTINPFTVLTSEEQKQPTISGFSPTSGNIGQEVTVSGTNFGNDASRITITLVNGTVISPKSVTPTQIVFILPPNSVTGVLSLQIIGFQKIATINPFTVLPLNEKITKTVGVSWVNISTDKDDKLNFAELYGGGNRIILKRGKGNTISSTILANPLNVSNDLTPQGFMYHYGQAIDNGVPIVNVNNSSHTNFTITGFDRAKTGYDELRLVMQKFVYPSGNVSSGYSNLNYRFLQSTYNGKSNADFNSSFIRSLFTGEIEVVDVQLSKPKAENRYIVHDEVVTGISGWYSVTNKKVGDLDIQSPWWRGLFTKSTDPKYLAVGNSLKAEWVNADKVTITKTSERYPYYRLKFENIKTGGWDQIVYPSDITNKVFLRITGFDPEVTGYNELRLFLADNGNAHGVVDFEFSTKPNDEPTANFVKETFRVMDDMKCYYLAPKFP